MPDLVAKGFTSGTIFPTLTTVISALLLGEHLGDFSVAQAMRMLVPCRIGIPFLSVLPYTSYFSASSVDFIGSFVVSVFAYSIPATCS